jgi:hypothetical protein
LSDPQLAHPVEQSRPREAEPRSGAITPSNYPADLPKGLNDVVPLGSGQGTHRRWRVALDHVFELAEREVQLRPA